jgi:hypothetical protein
VRDLGRGDAEVEVDVAFMRSSKCWRMIGRQRPVASNAAPQQRGGSPPAS